MCEKFVINTELNKYQNGGKLSLGNIVALIYKCIFSCIPCVPAIFQDVGFLRQNLDGQEIKRGKTKVFNSKQRSW